MPARFRSVQDIQLVQECFAALEPRLTELVRLFYAELFANNPLLCRRFPMGASDFATPLKTIVAGLDRIEQLTPALESLAERHAAYGASPANPDELRAALLGALAKCAGDAWTKELEGAWASAYLLVASAMLRASIGWRTRGRDAVPETLRSRISPPN